MTAPGLTIYFDGSCPICRLEVRALRATDRRGRLAYVDIAASGSDACPAGTDLAALNREPHAVAAEGTVLKGVDTLIAADTPIGAAWAMLPLRIRPLRPVMDWGYHRFARNRHRLSRQLGLGCGDGACGMPRGGAGHAC
jgi:predicted DCC family thiol-disulfide oxidoreductase YuxK